MPLTSSGIDIEATRARIRTLPPAWYAAQPIPMRLSLALLPTESGADYLTDHQTDVLRRFAAGGTLETIAADLRVARSTVVTHRKRALDKLHARSTMHGVAEAIRLGLI